MYGNTIPRLILWSDCLKSQEISYITRSNLEANIATMKTTLVLRRFTLVQHKNKHRAGHHFHSSLEQGLPGKMAAEEDRYGAKIHKTKMKTKYAKEILPDGTTPTLSNQSSLNILAAREPKVGTIVD